MEDIYRPVKVVGIAGSLRKGSYNRALLDAAVELAPDNMEIEVLDIAPVPMYNADLDNDDDRPEAVRRLKQAVGEAEAILFVTPEYNWGIPGVLKNAIDWASRPVGRSPMTGKTAAIMGATQGMWGTIRAQDHLRDILASMRVAVVTHPQVLVHGAADKFDRHMNLIDEDTRSFVRQLLENLRDEAMRRRISLEGLFSS